MNPSQSDKKSMLEKLASQVRTGGKGTMRRKTKRVHTGPVGDEKKIQATLKQCGASQIPSIDSVELFKDDGTVISFKQPKANANFNANMMAVSGHAETKSLTDFLMSLTQQHGDKKGFEGLPDLVSGLNFEAAAAAAAAAAAPAAAAPAPAAEEKKETPAPAATA
ncbi:putative transcription factor BTF3 4 [Paratrimastix pyriformis]|uniref:Nascent polypeptide-associated complex subunit beta n=1 Tax=Paratrimastix pyriformis TaxID=342808 RepID=A0ABQ8U6W8_9EUKA|nr:putative transcription factor BTF3 4 [Paratrimastix pyriformis]|eukprot:EC834915.1.p1 GENE.EC834915.1~~EC834915.1.p1  ORF type:complete len:174 (+),score=56.34 EC834915.1:29-523(+)